MMILSQRIAEHIKPSLTVSFPVVLSDLIGVTVPTPERNTAFLVSRLIGSKFRGQGQDRLPSRAEIGSDKRIETKAI